MVSNNKNHMPSSKDELDIRKIFFIILGHWKLFVIAMAVTGMAAFLYLRYKLPVYRTTATILIEEGKNQTPAGTAEILEGIGLQPGNRNLDNQMLILGSYSLIEKTVKELPFSIEYYTKGRISTTSSYPNDLIRVITDTVAEYNREFKFQYKGNHNFRLTAEDSDIDTVMQFGNKLRFNKSEFSIFADPAQVRQMSKGDEIIFVFRKTKELIMDYRKRLIIESLSKDGTIIKLTLEGTDREKDRAFLDKLTEKFLESNLDKKNREASRMIEFIDLQLIGISDSLMITEDRLQEFRSDHRVMDISAQGNQIIEQAVKLEDEKARLLLESNYFDYLNQYLSTENSQETPIAPATMGIADPLLAQLVQELSQLQADYYSGGIGKKNPLQAQMVQRINNTRESLQETLKNMMQANSLAKNENNEQIRTINTQAAGLPRTERKLLGIEREFKLNDVMYTFLLQKRAEAQIQKASNTPDNELIDRSMYDDIPVSPKPELIWLIAFISGILVPAVYVLLYNLFNTRITTEDELKNLTDLPISGHIPHSNAEYQVVVLKDPESGVAESFRSLRSRMQFFIKETKSPVILVTSSIPGEGKSFIALNLASAYSLTGKKTILVGFDLRRPKLYGDFNLINELGVSTFLIGKHTFQDIIQPTGFSDLDFISAGPIPPNPAELAASGKLIRLINTLREKYDIIIIDSAPIGTVSDSYSLASHADAILMVVRHKKTIMNMLESTLGELKDNDIKGISMIINDMDIQNVRYKYSYSYKYGYKYEKSVLN
jgi:capsular exopolysaccharide synthesis family protein